MKVLNRSFAWSSLWIFGLVYFLGALAEILPKPLAQSFVNLLFIRKHLSIFGVFFLMVHVYDVLLIFGENYFGKHYVEKGANMKWNIEIAM